MSEDDDESDGSYTERFFSVNEVNIKDMKGLGVIPLTTNNHEDPSRSMKRVNVGCNFKVCDKVKDQTVSENKRPKLVSPNKFLYRRKIHSMSYNNADLQLSTLPNEILLSIVQYLPRKSLCNLSKVSKRLYTVVTDESLWQRINLTGRKLSTNWLMHILRRGIRVAKISGSEIESPLMTSTLFNELINFHLKIEYLDLSEAVISVKDLELLLSKCRKLKKLSLEACELSDGVCKEIAGNPYLDTLNLCMCTGIKAYELGCIMLNCQLLESLNIAWTSLDKLAINELVSNISPNIRRLNLSGLRQTLKDRHAVVLIKRCPELLELDLSDCLEISSSTINCISENLLKLKSLSISRCYRINPSVLSELSLLPNFNRLNGFRLVVAEMMSREGILPNVKINKDFLSTIARPTVGIRKSSIWQIRCN